MHEHRQQPLLTLDLQSFVLCVSCAYMSRKSLNSATVSDAVHENIALLLRHTDNLIVGLLEDDNEDC